MTIGFEAKNKPAVVHCHLGVIEKTPTQEIDKIQVAVAAFRVVHKVLHHLFVGNGQWVEVDAFHVSFCVLGCNGQNARSP